MPDFGRKHCDKWLVKDGRYCDEPATVCTFSRYRCWRHDPLKEKPKPDLLREARSHAA